jgi:ribosome maturation factor RimP
MHPQNQALYALLGPVVADLGYELWGLEQVSAPGRTLLRVYIDSAAGISVDDCARVSRRVAGLLDVEDPIRGPYDLEVSSPGLDRPLFTPAQFERFVGEEVKINVNLPIDGRRRFHGTIRSVEGDCITIEQDGEPVTIVHANVAKARLAPDYAALGLAAAKSEYEEGRARRRGAKK